MQQSGHDRPLTPTGPRNMALPSSPQAAASVGLPTHDHVRSPPDLTAQNPGSNGHPRSWEVDTGSKMKLELEDGAAYEGFGFGAEKSISGELVFQTGMVGYPESITDPSYRGQILVVTFPLIGNYGVPSRDMVDGRFHDMPAHFEARQIHVSGLVVASYSGEDYSHHLAKTSLGTWLKEQNIPAMYGVDTRALTKRIRQEGSMLGKLLVEMDQSSSMVNGHIDKASSPNQPRYEHLEWTNPNARNLAADGESFIPIARRPSPALTFIASLRSGASTLLPVDGKSLTPSVWSSHQSLMR